jgi:Putative zinc-finger
MTRYGRLTCAEVLDRAPELALGILPARERAAAMAHLQDCSSCREQVRQYVRAADGLLELVPPAEPPAGFETRVLRRLGLRPAEPRPRSPRRFLRRAALTAAAAATAFAAAIGGWVIAQPAGETVPAVTAPGAHPGDQLSAAALTLPGPTGAPDHTAGRTIGRAFAFGGNPPWVYVSVDSDQLAGRIDGTLRCQVQRGDDSTATIGTFHVSDGYGQWGGAYPAGSAPLTGLRLITSNGTVVATTTFTPAPP